MAEPELSVRDFFAFGNQTAAFLAELEIRKRAAERAQDAHKPRKKGKKA
jgi:hypothetical protein